VTFKVDIDHAQLYSQYATIFINDRMHVHFYLLLAVLTFCPFGAFSIVPSREMHGHWMLYNTQPNFPTQPKAAAGNQEYEKLKGNWSRFA
jgi:hypothetical protein